MKRCRLFAFIGSSAAICAAWTIASDSAISQDARNTATLRSQHCQSAKKDPARTACKGNPGGPAHLSQQPPVDTGTWQLTRTTNPAGGPDSISVSKISDAARSDHDIAGLMLRCGEGATTEVLLVLFEPLPPRTHPKVTVSAGATTAELTGSVVTPGALVLLPEKASALVERAWRSIPELAVAISENRRSLHGVIPVADISTAMRTLQSNCLK